jgi:hypothetical protein
MHLFHALIERCSISFLLCRDKRMGCVGNGPHMRAAPTDTGSLRLAHTLGNRRRTSMPNDMSERKKGDLREHPSPPGKKGDRPLAEGETVSTPGGFKNDPDDPANPNEVREKHLRKLKQPG